MSGFQRRGVCAVVVVVVVVVVGGGAVVVVNFELHFDENHLTAANFCVSWLYIMHLAGIQTR